jgi:hypothetical protein
MRRMKRRKGDVLRLGPFLDIILTLLFLTPRENEDILGVQSRYNVIPLEDFDESFILSCFGSRIHFILNIIECASDSGRDVGHGDGPLLSVVSSDSEGCVGLDISGT